jgi:Flp pilus assembly pilin Flp
MNKLYIMLISIFGDLEERADSLRGQANEDRGAALVEYGLLVGFIAVVTVGAVIALGGSIGSMFDAINTAIPG